MRAKVVVDPVPGIPSDMFACEVMEFAWMHHEG